MPRTHAVRAVLELRRRIVSGELPGGARLYEVPLAETLLISRTPLREAMARLAEEGLLERARGGYVVRTFRYADIVDAIELRGVLEGTVLRLAAERGPDRERFEAMRAIAGEIDACLRLTDESDAFAAYFEANTRFHNQLAGLAGSVVLEREVVRISRLPFAAPSASLPDRTYFAEHRPAFEVAQGHHRAMIAAVAAGQGSRAEHLGREHALHALSDLQSVLRSRGIEPGTA
jgi:GntR family transcriptional regulator, vanillate catabolism transcriptional regulator